MQRIKILTQLFFLLYSNLFSWFGKLLNQANVQERIPSPEGLR